MDTITERQHIGTLSAVIGQIETSPDQPAIISLRPLSEWYPQVQALISQINQSIHDGLALQTSDGDRFVVSTPVTDDALASLGKVITVSSQHQVALLISPSVVRNPESFEFQE